LIAARCTGVFVESLAFAGSRCRAFPVFWFPGFVLIPGATNGPLKTNPAAAFSYSPVETKQP
jgi:hypothetical protein